MLLRFRGFIFTLLAPALIGGWIPLQMANGEMRGDWFALGWFPVIAGAFIYGLCLFRFLVSGGTPAIFFSRHLRFLIGEEPGQLVNGGLYRWSRNPMYVGVVMAVFGQAILFGSRRIAVYGLGLWGMFHLVVVLLEEPHLRRLRGTGYEEYCRTVRRWL